MAERCARCHRQDLSHASCLPSRAWTNRAQLTAAFLFDEIRGER